jgi:plasmid stabilization system protein ParE
MAGKLLPVVWSARSLVHAVAIREYLLTNFSQKEVDRFYTLLEKFERNVSRFPNLYPATHKKKNLRRAVLHKNFSVFYKKKRNQIFVAAILDNRQDWMKLISRL